MKNEDFFAVIIFSVSIYYATQNILYLLADVDFSLMLNEVKELYLKIPKPLDTILFVLICIVFSLCALILLLKMIGKFIEKFN